jgi:radical SAM superfamily enzyme YgiQ (UPF0313 family)
MKILLIQPPNAFLKQAYGVKQKVSFGHTPPLGLAIIASYLEKDGHEIKIIDAVAMELSIDETADIVMRESPELVGITAMTNYKDMAKVLSDAIRKVLPSVTIVLGGSHATYYQSEILDEMPNIDHVIYGEADLVINDYVKHLNDTEGLRNIPGLIYRGADFKSVVNPPPPLLEDLDKVPFPAWHLLDMKLYRPLPLQYRKLPWFALITSRGCWWRKCTFCFQAGRKAVPFRKQTPKRVIEELDVLHKRYGIKEVNFFDDAFLVNAKWISDFRVLAEERKIDVCWTSSVRIDSISEDLLDVAKKAGCWSVFIGVESGDQMLLDSICKGTEIGQIRKAFSLIDKFGIETRAAFMLGLPKETPELGRKTIDFALSLDPTYAIFYATHPRKGTILHEQAMVVGAFIDHNFRGMSKITYVPEGYEGPEQLEKMISGAYKKFYLRPKVILRTVFKIRSFNAVKEIVLAFFLFMGLSGNKSSYG